MVFARLLEIHLGSPQLGMTMYDSSSSFEIVESGVVQLDK
jgi:hypothetical protein